MARRSTAVSLVLLVAAAGCASTQAASPPRPELVGAEWPEPPPSTAVLDRAGGVGDQLPAEPPVAADPVRPADRTIAGSGGPTQRVDAPAFSGLTGWAAFDDSIRRDILGNGSVGVSVAVMVDGEVVRTSSFGARVAGELPRVDPDDRFRVASISKTITAIVVLQLVEEGRVSLEDPIGGRLAEWLGVQVGSDATAGITAEQLLAHTSGVSEFDMTFFGDGVGPCPDAARVALARPVGSVGGFRYSNMNYCLAGLLIEMITGQPYQEAVAQRLLAPLGISGMRLAGTYDVGPDEVRHESRPGRAYMEALGAAGAWIASARDVALIVDSIDPGGTGWRPLGDDLLGRLRRPPASRPADAGYGLGLILYPDGSVGHTGTLENTHAMVLNRPDGVTWAILVNGEHPRNSSTLRQIVDRALAAGFPEG